MMTAPNEKPRPRQTRELARRLGLLTQAQAAAGWAIIIILIALLGAIYLNQTSAIARIGRQVQRDLDELDEVRWANAELEHQIGQTQAMDRLDAEARRLGFVPARPADIDFMIITNYPMGDAAEPGEPTPVPALPDPPETFWQALTWALRDLGIGLTRGEANE